MSGKLNTINMLEGRPLPQILRFSIPLAASSMLQLLFNAADVIVVGKFVGSTALAAVGSNGSLINLLIGLFLGISVGVNITVARMVGERNDDGVRRAVSTTVVMAAVLGVFVGAMGMLLATPMLRLMHSPEDVLPLASLYLRIYFLGVPGSLMYNFCAGVLRAYGDTKKPFVFLSVAGVVNVVLNLFFVIVLKIGVAGVAIATIASQYISAFLVVRSLALTDGPAHLDLRGLRYDHPTAMQIVRIGIPAGLQSVLFNVSNVVIQSSVNSFGSAFVAGNSAATNIGNFANAACVSVYHASLSFTSQNYGARRYRRLLSICGDSFLAILIIGVPLAAVQLLFGPQLLSIYISRADPAFDTVVSVGMARLRLVGALEFVCASMSNAGALVRGLGKSWLPLLVSVFGSVVLRIVWVMTIFQAYRTPTMLYISYPISWLLTACMHLACFFWFYRRLTAAARSREARARGTADG